MVINRNSWHYRLQREVVSTKDPKTLCQYFRRVVFSATFGVALYAFLFLLINLVIFPMNILFGWIPVAPVPWCDKDRLSKYKGRDVHIGDLFLWRPARFYLFEIRGWKIYPAYFVLSPLYIWLLFACEPIFIVSAVLVAVVGTGGSLFLLGVGVWYLCDSEMTHLVRARIKAWKDGVCPMIEYVGEKSGGERDSLDSSTASPLY